MLLYLHRNCLFCASAIPWVNQMRLVFMLDVVWIMFCLSENADCIKKFYYLQGTSISGGWILARWWPASCQYSPTTKCLGGIFHDITVGDNTCIHILPNYDSILQYLHASASVRTGLPWSVYGSSISRDDGKHHSILSHHETLMEGISSANTLHVITCISCQPHVI